MKEIGLENLPNIYISEIAVLRPTRKRKRFKIEMITKDQRVRGKYSWYGSEDLGKYLQILVVCSANENINNRLDSGTLDFNKKLIRSLDRSNNVQIATISIKQNEVDDRFELIDNKKVYSFIYDKKFHMPINAQNVKVYCAVMLDTKAYSSEQGIDLLGPLVSSYSGPVASETILKNGKTVNTTTVLLDQSNNTYSGPYHRHSSGRLMEGSFHSNQPHGFLTEQQVPNMKMKSYVDMPLSIRRRIIKGSRKIISELTTSYNENGSGSLFSLNIRNLLLTRTLRGQILASVNPYLFNKAVQTTKILKLRVYEEKIQTKAMLSKIGTKRKSLKRRIRKRKILTTKDLSGSSTIIPKSRHNVSIKEIVMSDKVDIRNFILEQKASFSKKGELRYSVVYEIYNPIEAMVQENYQELLQGFKILKSYFFRSQLPNNKTSNNRRFTQEFVDKETQRASVLNTSIQYYIEAYSMFNSLTDQEEIDMSQNIMSLIRPEYATPESLAWFFRRYQILLNYYKRIFRIKERKNADVGSKGNTSKNGAGFRLFVSKTFRDTLSFEKTKSLINVMDTKDPMPILSKNQFRRRYIMENKKFLSSRPNFFATELSRSDRGLARNMSKINEHMPSYLTPLFLNVGKKRINTENFEALDESEILQFYKKVLSLPQDKTFIERKQKKRSKLRIRRPRGLASTNKFKPVIDNLGDNSSFVNAEESFKNSKTLKLPNQIKNAFSLRDLPNRDIKDYSMKNPRLRQRLLRRPQQAVKIPLSIKTLMVAENPRTKNSEILTKTDFVSNYKTFPTFDIFYNTPIKVEFTIDGKSWQLMTQSIFNRLRENVICRLSYYYYEGLTYKKDLSIANEYFILSAGRIRNTRIVARRNNIDNARLLDLTTAVSNYNLTYSTSNIISQPQTRNTAFGTRGESNTQNVTVETTSTPVPSAVSVPTGGSTSGGTSGGGTSYGY
tara:strand:- start:4685 stop:7537 length:2853 start_codon:yes stop_codon:yes gene_type:complete